MAFSYSGLRNYGKSTLPSVDAGLGSMNVLRDPPKSLYTKRKDKVNVGGDLTQMVEDSSDRNCEYITHFARGVDPMVSVSYSNYGNNGGQRRNTTTSSGINVGQAYLPNRIGAAGSVVRPPVLTQFNLLPLSRLPRTSTSAFTNKEFPDFQRKLFTQKPAEKTREVNFNKLNTFIRPTKTYIIEKPQEKTYDNKNNIQDKLLTSGFSGYRSRDITQNNVVKPYHGIENNNVNISANTNKATSRNNVLQSDVNNKNTENYIQDTNHSNIEGRRTMNINSKYLDETNNINSTGVYIQDTNHTEIQSNKMKNINVTSIEELNNNNRVNLRDNINTNYTTPLSMLKQQDYIHENIELDRNLPQYNAVTNNRINKYVDNIENKYIMDKNRSMPSTSAYSNIKSNVSKLDTYDSRDIVLKPTISAGGYSNLQTKPTTERFGELTKMESLKDELNRKAVQNFDSRYRNGIIVGDSERRY
jgi:hypothetical protein